mgnify:CR=1 FL=1
MSLSSTELTAPPVAVAPAAEPIIALTSVVKTYGQGDAAFQALRGVSLTIQRGEFVAITGPSGSGKSTLMNILGCLDTPTSGSYRFRGVEVERLTRSQRALLRRHYLGFVFQGFNLLKRTSALENVDLPLLYRGVRGRARRQSAMAALALVGLGAIQNAGFKGLVEYSLPVFWGFFLLTGIALFVLRAN